MGSTIKNKRGLHYKCERSLEEMRPVDGGHFCLRCQQKVTDFTGWSREELEVWFQRVPETCGQFEPHQIDPSLVPLGETVHPMQHGFLASLLALTVGTGQAQERPAPAPTEQLVPTPAPDPATFQIQVNAKCVGSGDPHACATVTPVQRKEPTHRIYLSKRFPFIHVKQRNWRGRVRRQDIIF